MTLDSIIERLEKAESGDRGLDLTIMNLLAPRAEDEKHFVMGKLLGAKWGAYGHMANQIEYFIEAPKITSSVDAAIALVRKIFPDCTISTDCWPSKAHVAICAGPTPPSIVEGDGHHSSQAIATVIAALKAKQMGVGE